MAHSTYRQSKFQQSRASPIYCNFVITHKIRRRYDEDTKDARDMTGEDTAKIRRRYEDTGNNELNIWVEGCLATTLG